VDRVVQLYNAVRCAVQVRGLGKAVPFEGEG